MKKSRLKKCTLIFGSWLTANIIICFPAPAQDLPGKLVSSEWLAANLSRPNLRIIDMRIDIRDYWQSHIPSSVYVDSSMLRWPENGVPVKLLPAEAMAILLGNIGISENTSVVVYFEKNGYVPFYLIWALDYIGHKSSALLEDGFERWRREGRPLSQDYPKITPVKYRLPAKLHPEVRATLDEVINEMKSGALLLDVRSQEFYSGERGTWKRKGHIKGAVHHFWAWDMSQDGTWKSREELLKSYESIGATPDKTIIVSCGQGQMAAHTYFTLKYLLGFPNVRLYDGSFHEWSNIDTLPVETGIK